MGEKYKMDNQEKLIKIETIQNLLIAHATGSNENTNRSIAYTKTHIITFYA